MKKILTLVFASILLFACSETKNSKVLGDKKAGESLTGWYYYHLTQSQFDSIPTLLNAEDFTKSQQNELIGIIKDRQEKFGAIKSFNLKDWQQTESNKKEKTKDFLFEYEVNYQDKTVVEKIFVEKKENTLKITGIEFN